MPVALQTPGYAVRIRWATCMVPSETDPTKSYEVALDPSTGRPFDCSCPDSVNRRRQCKHQRTVMAGGGSKPRVRAVQVPAENIQVHHRAAFEQYVAKAASSVASVGDLYGD